MIFAASAFIVACLMALMLVPLLARSVAKPLGLLDQPDDNRKLHRKAIPLVGGIAVFLAVSVTSIGVYFAGLSELGGGEFALEAKDKYQFLGMLIGGAFLLLVGIVDDSIGLRGRQKLIGQIIAVAILIVFGFNFESMRADQTLSFEFRVFSGLIVFGWCLAVINSINLLDGADGFASTVGIVMSLALSVMALYHQQMRMMDAIIVLALAGALMGFLRFNFPPARVFLGDAGSMLIGFILAAISIRCTLKQATSYAFFAPIALLAIPFLDTAAAIIRRKMTGRSIYSVDRGHLHHSMMKRGFGPRVSLVWVAALCSMTAAGATISFLTRQTEYALVSIVVVVLVMVFGRIFGVAEVELVSNKAKTIGKALVGGAKKKQEDFHQSTVQLQGTRDWKEVWSELCEFSDEHELNQLTFDINLPWLHESFHATRRRTDVKKIENDEWYCEIPLIVGDKIFGRVELAASKSSHFTHHEIISHLLKLTSDLEPVLQEKAGMETDTVKPIQPTLENPMPASSESATTQ